MRIGQALESDGPGGAEIVVRNLAEELRRRGHVVVPIGPERGTGWLAAEFRDRGFEPRTFSLRRALDWRCVEGLRRLIREERLDVLHSHEFTMAVYGAVACRLEGCRHVVTYHGSQTMTRAWRRRAALRLSLRLSDASVAVSASTQRQLVADLGVAPSAVGVTRNGVPVRPGNPAPVRAELGVREGEVLLLAVGNLDPRKGHMILLRALARLEEEGLQVPWRLAIAGGRGGPEHEPLLDFARRHDMAERVHVLLNRSDVPDLQAAADVFVMPSLWEGLPLAILEAMLAGNPVVASGVSGIPEAVTDGTEGLLVPPGDPGPLAAALRRVLEDARFRRLLGEAARERAMREFTVAAMADAYERLYRGGHSEAAAA